MSFAWELLSVSALASLVFLCGASQSTARATCDEYAKQAVEANKFNLANNCGFTGGPWSGDYNAHKQWCLGQQPQQVQHETDARNRFIKACQRKQAATAACDEYAKQAVEANQVNVTKICGFTGGPWSFNYEAHKQWCLGQQPRQVQQETDARNGLIKTCQECVKYAKQAVEDYIFNQGHNCGFTGDAWSDDYNGHKQWCLGAQPQQVQEETHARNIALNGCDPSRLE
jgi:hypothetical protein